MSAIESGKIEETARGITMMKQALEGFGEEGILSLLGKLIGGGGPIEDLLKLAKEHEILTKAANAIMAILMVLV